MAGNHTLVLSLASRRRWLSISKISFSRWRYFSLQRMLGASYRFNYFNQEKKKHGDNNKASSLQQEKDDLPRISIAARMLIQSASNTNSNSSIGSSVLKNSSESSQKDLSAMKSRLQHVSDNAGKTVSSIEDLVSKERPHTESLTSNIDLENAVEVLAFKQDFERLKKPSPLHGTEDPSAKASEIPCTGCGAHLQCNNRIFPGFMVSEFFKVLSRRELKRSICQRCHYMRHGSAFKEVMADPESYAEMISQIRPTRSIVVMVVDLTDIQGSIVPDLTRYIGSRKPVIVVGNKADLLAPDDPNYMKNVRRQLEHACKSAGLKAVKEYRLISAKTGFGVEKLITTLFNFYKLQVDVYIVGTANSGKSSLFNMLLGSDYCKNTARDLIQRATVSEWPGTTLNLLKFPIMRPSREQDYVRVKRLKQEKAMRKEAERLALNKEQQEHEQETWELTENVGISDMRTASQIRADEKALPWGQEVVSFKGRRDGGFIALSQSDSRLEMTEFNADYFAESYWVYDTPGIINPDQVMNCLNSDDCTLVTPTSMIVPRCVVLRSQDTIFISGLGRIDILECDVPVFLTVHSSSVLPIRIGPTEEADSYYTQNIGTEELVVPTGDEEDLSKLPALEGEELVVKGAFKGNIEAAADIQLSSIGFVSVGLKRDSEVRLRAWTPGGKGLVLRPPLLPHFPAFRGTRIAGTPFYRTKPQGSVLAGKETTKLEEYEFSYPVAKLQK